MTSSFFSYNNVDAVVACLLNETIFSDASVVYSPLPLFCFSMSCLSLFLRICPSIQIILSMLVASRVFVHRQNIGSLLMIYIFYSLSLSLTSLYELVVINFIGKTLPTQQLHFYRWCCGSMNRTCMYVHK